MAEKQARIRWDDDELGRLAADMAPRLLADPELHPLEAVRLAQKCLKPKRRRELKAWSLVEGRLQPWLDDALGRLRTKSTPPAAVETTSDALAPVPVAEAATSSTASVEPSTAPAVEAVPPQDSEEAATELDATARPGQSLQLFDDQATPQTSTSAQHPAGPSRTGRGAAKASPVAAVDPAAVDIALLAALQSPAVEEALVELFSRTMAKALLRTGTGEARPMPAQTAKSPVRRVLLAGFADAEQRALTAALLGERYDVRTWKPVNGPQLFHTLARQCGVVVFPEHADEEADAGLKDMDVRVIRHAGNASRLVDRLGDLD